MLDERVKHMWTVQESGWRRSEEILSDHERILFRFLSNSFERLNPNGNAADFRDKFIDVVPVRDRDCFDVIFPCYTLKL